MDSAGFWIFLITTFVVEGKTLRLSFTSTATLEFSQSHLFHTREIVIDLSPTMGASLLMYKERNEGTHALYKIHAILMQCTPKPKTVCQYF